MPVLSKSCALFPLSIIQLDVYMNALSGVSYGPTLGPLRVEGVARKSLFLIAYCILNHLPTKAKLIKFPP